MSVLLRTAQESDLEAIGGLHQRSRAAAYAHILSPEALDAGGAQALGEWWAERWKWERDTHRLTVAELDGAVIGFLYVGPSEEPDAAELYAIHVAPDHVGTGVGKALMVTAQEQLRQIARRAHLWVLEGNERARRFYERGGWRPDGTTRTEAVNGEPVAQLRYSRSLVGGST
nr:GNAT family N-acetyltransferase [uncultured Actinoplanes sp.]